MQPECSHLGQMRPVTMAQSDPSKTCVSGSWIFHLPGPVCMIRGLCGSLIFHCVTLSFTAPRRFNRRTRTLSSPKMCRFIPALSVPKLLPSDQTGWGLLAVSITTLTSSGYKRCFNRNCGAKCSDRRAGAAFGFARESIPRLKSPPA